jgi:hypothetical protein
MGNDDARSLDHKDTGGRKLLDRDPAVRDLRDRALIATLTYSFARIPAALRMKVEDLRPQGAGWRLRLHEKGGKHHTMPGHHALAEVLHAYIAAASIAKDRKGWLFRTSRGHNAAMLSGQPMNQSDAWRMIRRRAVAAGIHAPIGNHTFRATGITAYLANGGALEHAQEMAAHDQALRPDERAAHTGRSGEDQVLNMAFPRQSGTATPRRSSRCAGSVIEAQLNRLALALRPVRHKHIARQGLVRHLSGFRHARHRQVVGIQPADLHKNGSLIPVGVLMHQLAVTELHDGDKRHLDLAAGGRHAWQHPVDLGGVREAEQHLIH